MQKVFKLIIDELKKAARSELKIYGGARSNGKSILLGYQKGLEDAVFIVNQTIKEYNNGWIPCSERLPKPYELVLIQNAYGVMSVASRTGERWFNFQGTELWQAVAWQPLPEPYKEGE